MVRFPADTWVTTGFLWLSLFLSIVEMRRSLVKWCQLALLVEIWEDFSYWLYKGNVEMFGAEVYSTYPSLFHEFLQ